MFNAGHEHIIAKVKPGRPDMHALSAQLWTLRLIGEQKMTRCQTQLNEIVDSHIAPLIFCSLFYA